MLTTDRTLKNRDTILECIAKATSLLGLLTRGISEETHDRIDVFLTLSKAEEILANAQTYCHAEPERVEIHLVAAEEAAIAHSEQRHAESNAEKFLAKVKETRTVHFDVNDKENK